MAMLEQLRRPRNAAALGCMVAALLVAVTVTVTEGSLRFVLFPVESRELTGAYVLENWRHGGGTLVLHKDMTYVERLGDRTAEGDWEITQRRGFGSCITLSEMLLPGDSGDLTEMANVRLGLGSRWGHLRITVCEDRGIYFRQVPEPRPLGR